MFDKEYSFKGKHAHRVEALTESLDNNIKGVKIFDRNFDVYFNAPLIGFLYGRKSEVDMTKEPEKNEVFTTKIFGDILIKHKPELEFNYRLIMLLDIHNEPSEQARITKAFRKMGELQSDIELYESYVCGGVDVLYEKILEGANSTEEKITRLCEFLSDFEERFNENVDLDSVREKCLVIE